MSYDKVILFSDVSYYRSVSQNSKPFVNWLKWMDWMTFTFAFFILFCGFSQYSVGIRKLLDRYPSK